MAWTIPSIFDIPMYVAPVSGATVVIPSGTTLCFINNPSLLASLTVTLPSGPVDGQRFTVCCASVITAITFNGGTINGSSGSLGANGYGRFSFSALAGAWFRTG